jgi:uncharacterized repeat protein (TIGR03803 family)
MTPSGVVDVVYALANLDGRLVYGPVVQTSDGTLYGTSFNGGAFDLGTVFRLIPCTSVTCPVPDVVTEMASGRTRSTATLNGTANPNGFATVGHFGTA